MNIITAKDGTRIKVIDGNIRLVQQIKILGEAKVELDGKVITVISDQDGNLVEKPDRSDIE